MIVAIRISGPIKLKASIEETLSRLRLKRKFSCVVFKPTKENIGMINKVRDFVAYGEVKKETFEKLIEKRGQLIDKKKKIDPKRIYDEIENGKKYVDLNLKPFFRLHPPRGGMDVKRGFGDKKGVLGNNKEHINELLERML